MYFLSTNYNFFHVSAHNGKGGVFWTRAELAEYLFIYTPVAKKVVKSDDKKKYID